jgi:hypothetical protein
MEHDNPWKEAVEDLFDDFLFFFFPEIHRDVDFSKGYQFLEKELHKIIKSSKTGKRYGDKLVKVFLADGSEKWLLIHIEIQGYKQENFPERMYIYNYRIFDKFRKEVISLALLTDANPRFRPNEYRRSHWGFEILCRYPLVKLIDYRERLAELEASSHPFAIIVRAYLRTLEMKGNIQERYSWKKKFLLELYQHGLKRETILAIYKFIDLIMALPEALESELYDEIKVIEEKSTMPHITTAERIGMKKGMEKGMEEGIEKGIEKSISAVHQALAAIIEIKFGEAGDQLRKNAYRMKNLEILQKLIEKLKRAQTLTEAELIFAEMETRKRAQDSQS